MPDSYYYLLHGKLHEVEYILTIMDYSTVVKIANISEIGRRNVLLGLS